MEVRTAMEYRLGRFTIGLQYLYEQLRRYMKMRCAVVVRNTGLAREEGKHEQ